MKKLKVINSSPAEKRGRDPVRIEIPVAGLDASDPSRPPYRVAVEPGRLVVEFWPLVSGRSS